MRVADLATCPPQSKDVCKESGITYLPTMHVYAKGDLVGSPQVSLKVFPEFVKEVGRHDKELKGGYVPRNQCDDNYWKCADTCELSTVEYDDTDGSAGAVGGPLGSMSEVV